MLPFVVYPIQRDMSEDPTKPLCPNCPNLDQRELSTDSTSPRLSMDVPSSIREVKLTVDIASREDSEVDEAGVATSYR